MTTFIDLQDYPTEIYHGPEIQQFYDSLASSDKKPVYVALHVGGHLNLVKVKIIKLDRKDFCNSTEFTFSGLDEHGYLVSGIYNSALVNGRIHICYDVKDTLAEAILHT